MIVYIANSPTPVELLQPLVKPALERSKDYAAVYMLVLLSTLLLVGFRR